jgi:hypothetical protein
MFIVFINFVENIFFVYCARCWDDSFMSLLLYNIRLFSLLAYMYTDSQIVFVKVSV